MYRALCEVSGLRFPQLPLEQRVAMFETTDIPDDIPGDTKQIYNRESMIKMVRDHYSALGNNCPHPDRFREHNV